MAIITLLAMISSFAFGCFLADGDAYLASAWAIVTIGLIIVRVARG